jgi:hypothetical protein
VPQTQKVMHFLIFTNFICAINSVIFLSCSNLAGTGEETTLVTPFSHFNSLVLFDFSAPSRNEEVGVSTLTSWCRVVVGLDDGDVMVEGQQCPRLK